MFLGRTISTRATGRNENLDVVVTFRNGYIHGRSLTWEPHWSQEWVKNFHASISHEIPENWCICGENLYATHSIKYTNLKSFFYGFSIWEGHPFWEFIMFRFCTKENTTKMQFAL